MGEYYGESAYFGFMWRMYVNGAELDDSRRFAIQSIEIEERCDGSDTMAVTVADPDFLFIEDNIFAEEATIKLYGRWSHSAKFFEFDGYISLIDIDFQEDGAPLLVLTCMDKSHLMNRGKKKRSWAKKTSKDVVSAIAMEYGFKTDIEEGYAFKTQDTISQSGQTDIEFLESLADGESIPWMCKLVGDTIIYRKLGLLGEPKAELAYREHPYTIKSFSPRIDKEGVPQETSQSDVGADKKKSDGKATAASAAKDAGAAQGDTVSTSSDRMYYEENSDNWQNPAKGAALPPAGGAVQP
jgi:hypothetical protein